MSIKFLVLGGGGYFGFFWGGECRFIFMGARIFLSICTETNSLKNLDNMRKMIPQKSFPVFARVRIQAPHVFAQKLIPQEFFPACIGFVPGGNRKRTFAVTVPC